MRNNGQDRDSQRSDYPVGSSQTGYVVDETNLKKRKTHHCDCCEIPQTPEGAPAPRKNKAPAGAPGSTRTQAPAGASDRADKRAPAGAKGNTGTAGGNTARTERAERRRKRQREDTADPEFACTVEIPPLPTCAPPAKRGLCAPGKGGEAETAAGGKDNKKGVG